MDLLYRDAHGQLAALASGAVTAVELLEASVARADALATSVNAVVARRLEAARAEARAVDEARARGKPLGRLAGLPMTVKDTFDVAGLPASAGVPELRKRQVEDAEVVRRVRAEGAVVWGQTNTPLRSSDWQTFNRLNGVTRNPWDLTRTPGGSSGGSAAALASGITALEIGADIAGSLRVPAAFCGVFSLKPSFGLISQAGIVPRSDTELDMAVVGPMARSARDLALLFSILSGQPEPSAHPLNALRIGMWLDDPAFAFDPEIHRIVGDFSKGLEAAGAKVEAARPRLGGREILEIYTALAYPVIFAEAPIAERMLYRALGGPAKLARALGAGPVSWANGVLRATASHREWLRADAARARAAPAMASLFERFDLLLAPVAPTAAFPHDHRQPIGARRLRLSDGGRVAYLQVMSWAALASVWGLPAAVVPAGRTAQGVPVGIQLIARRGDDALALAAAQAIEAATGGFEPPPL